MTPTVPNIELPEPTQPIHTSASEDKRTTFTTEVYKKEITMGWISEQVGTRISSAQTDSPKLSMNTSKEIAKKLSRTTKPYRHSAGQNHQEITNRRNPSPTIIYSQLSPRTRMDEMNKKSYRFESSNFSATNFPFVLSTILYFYHTFLRI